MPQGIEAWVALVVAALGGGAVVSVPFMWALLRAALPVCKRLNTMYQQVNGMANQDDGQMKAVLDRMDRFEKGLEELQRNFMDYLTHRK